MISSHSTSVSLAVPPASAELAPRLVEVQAAGRAWSAEDLAEAEPMANDADRSERQRSGHGEVSDLRPALRRARLSGGRLGARHVRVHRMRGEGAAAAQTPFRRRDRHGSPAGGVESAAAGGASTRGRRHSGGRSTRLIVTGEAMLISEPRRLSATPDPELSVDVRQVVLDRLLAEPELARDLLVRPAGGDSLEDLALPGG